MKCGIITPIGPGHSDLFQRSCRASVERALGYSKGPFDEVTLYAMDDGHGRYGRSNRRNAAIAQAQGDGVDWLFLLDADDELAPNAFEAFGQRLAAEPEIDALWGLICEFGEDGEPQLREGQPETLDSYEDFLTTPPYLAVQIGAFIRTEVLARYGFDEAMDTGEDYKLYLQLWQNARCRKRPEIFFINRRGQHSTGPRQATGQDWNAATDRLWAEAVAAHPVWAQVASDGVTARLRVEDPHDPIQHSHLEGRFHEAEALQQLKRFLKPGARIVEVGANIGNRVIWYALHLSPASILPVEPDPAAISLLEQNITGNGIGGMIDRRGLGLGAGRAGPLAVGSSDAPPVPEASGGMPVVALDKLLDGTQVDFIKIGPESVVLDVLQGAADTIARDRPLIWVAALRQNILPFAQKWCRANRYHLADSVPRVDRMEYFAVPMERA